MIRRKGFTLVELLIVVAIISVLAALLLPALQQAIESGRKVDCASRMKQFMLLASCYHTDFGYMLAATNHLSSVTVADPTVWNHQFGYRVAYDLYAEIDNRQSYPSSMASNGTSLTPLHAEARRRSLYGCPSATHFPAGFGGTPFDVYHTGGWDWYSSYSSIFLVEYGLSQYTHSGESWKKRTAKKSFKAPPSRMAYYLELTHQSGSYGRGGDWTEFVSTGTRIQNGTWPGTYWRLAHGKGANVACGDGHVVSFDESLPMAVSLGQITEAAMPFRISDTN